MDVEIKHIQSGYYEAISSAKSYLNLKYQNNAEIKNAIVNLIKTNNTCKDCKIEMEIYNNEYEWCCPMCGLLLERDVDSPYKIKKPTHEPVKLFLDWITHILAREKPNVQKISIIRNYLEQNNISKYTPNDLRNVLKQLKLGKYTKHTSYYFWVLTGIAPPDIPEAWIVSCKCLFWCWTLEWGKTYGGRNLPSYPYLIYKIFDIVLPEDDVENRRIFDFINLPSKATLKKRDKEWDIIYKNLYVK